MFRKKNYSELKKENESLKLKIKQLEKDVDYLTRCLNNPTGSIPSSSSGGSSSSIGISPPNSPKQDPDSFTMFTPTEGWGKSSDEF